MFARYLIALATALILSTPCQISAGSQPSNAVPSLERAVSQLSSMPLSFTQNNGQWPDSILFRANTGGATMWFTPTGAYYQFTRSIAKVGSLASNAAFSTDQIVSPIDRLKEDSLETLLIKARFVGCNSTAQMTGEVSLEHKCNYFLGNDQSKWRTDVPNYKTATYKGIYPGIDLKYYGDGRQMEYDFIVRPGADYSQVKIKYEGAKSVSVTASGDLLVETGWGTVTEKAPVVYQFDGSNRISVASAYRMNDDNSFGFSLGPSYNSALAVTIDPVLTYSTYLGGGSNDQGAAIAADSSGATYVTGYTQSTNFPTMNPYQGTLNSFSVDIFVIKLSSAGSLVYSTYLGGSSIDQGFGIAVDPSGKVCVTGATFSSDFPRTNLIPSFPPTSIFVTRLSSTGNSLVYSTYVASGSGTAIAVDSSGAAYFTGVVASSITTLNPFQGTFGGVADAFVTKFSPTGSYVYSTYLGGSGSDQGNSIAVDASGRAYVTGYTSSSNFPTLNPFQATLAAGQNAFVTKLSSSGSSLIYSTYLGGSTGDKGEGIALDGSGAAYVTGLTYSSDFPMMNAYQSSFPGLAGYSAFVTKLTISGNSLSYSTFLSGTLGSEAHAVAADASGAAYVTGITKSTDFPMMNPYQGTYGGGNYDAFFTKFSSTGTSLAYSTYLGGIDEESGQGVAVGASGGAAYVTGYTFSSNFPMLHPFQLLLGGLSDVFVTKIGFPCCTGTTGNVNMSGIVDLGDLSALVSYLTGGGFVLPCPAAANVNASGIVDLGDLSALVSYLTGGGFILPGCP